jgi:hypothetical protein
MREVLIVSPRFPPINAADVHRIRTSLAYYRRFGWEPTVLCVDPATSDGIEDAMLAQALTPDIRVVRIRAWDEAKSRRFGFGQLSYRSLLPLYRAGSRLLHERRYDVVFFSTTVFMSFVLGRLWKRRFGCKIVYDFQDPWYSDPPIYTRETAPGSWWKYRLDQWLARHLERFAMRAADHVIAVSPAYIATLTSRYPWLDSSKFTVLPFGANADDYSFARKQNVKQTIFSTKPHVVRWVYAGRAGSDMTAILDALFQALAALKAQDAKFAAKLKLDFVGTNYASPERARKLVEPTARAYGIEELVREHPERVAYFQTIALYDASDAILLIGSVHADYTPSKLFSCILAKKPILALFHRQSPAVEIARRFPNVFLATFDDNPAEPQFRKRIAEGIAWLRTASFDGAAIDAEIEPWSANALTEAQCAIFDRVSVHTSGPTNIE